MSAYIYKRYIPLPTEIKFKTTQIMNGLLEILTNKHWMIRPEFVHSMMPVIQNNLNNHIELTEEREHEMGCRIVFASEGVETRIKEERYSAKDGRIIRSWADNKDDPFINVMFVDGPITRNGGACSYGSVEHRDMMMSAADNANCVGHIFHINTPGGSAWAKNDYQQAIDYARAKKQPVVAFVDGMCCSAGMYLAALCDERYYMHPKDEIGCIGVMAAFYTEKDGSTCEFSNETYHELYDPESFDKNKEFRDIANDGNSELLIQELAKLGVEFRADVKATCPKAKDEHLHGKVFDAQDVKGILMDDQKSLGEVFNVVIDRGVKNGLQSARNAMNMLNPNNNSINMKEKYPSLFAALQVEEMQMQEGGAFINEELLANLNAAIETAQKEKADALALVDSLKADHATAIENLNAEHQQAIDQLNEQLTAKGEELATSQQAVADLNEQVTNLNSQVETLNTTVEEQKGQIENLNTELAGAKESLTTAEGQLAEKDQTITDLNAQIEELQHDPGAEPAAGSPAHNGQGAEEPQMAVDQFVYDASKSYEENMRLKKEWQESHK